MRKFLSTFLALAMTLSLLAVPASAADPAPSETPDNAAERYFYNQLTAQGKAIYNALLDMYQAGTMRDGRGSYDLADKNVVTQADIKAYLEDGDRTLFNDFAAAKDAFDLEHPEAWYVDSSYLSFRVARDSGTGIYHALIGPGRSDNYYVYGVTGEDDVDAMTRELDIKVNSIVDGAKKIAGGSGTEDIAKQVQYVHKQVTESISYRYETDCKEENVGYVRTVYGLVTHEGVCEAYARSMQLILNRLDIPCVLIHGLQTSGTPESHMWNAVRIEGKWYVVDATWDDPVGLDANGNVKHSGRNGLDGTETETYLLVGQDVVGANWKPSGYVSTGAMEFEYPEIALVSFGSGIIEKNGLTVTYADSAMEGGESTLYHVSYNGKGLVESAKNGIYFLVKMYDVNADGSVDQFDDWYYSVHGLHSMGRTESDFDPNDDFRDNDSPYFSDSDQYLIYNVINCEYVEFAVTTKAPPDWKTADDLRTLGGYYSGDGSDILAETGLIYNPNGGYEQPPYVKNVSPLFNSPVYVGRTYTIHLEFTDPLYHPDQSSIDSAVDGKVNDAAKAMAQDVALDYEGFNYNWGVQARQPHTFSSGKPAPRNVRWKCDTHSTHSGMDGIGADCKLTTLEFEFSASTMWADDSVEYKFYLTGLVGVKSNKFVMDTNGNGGGWSYVFENQSAYCSYRCQGVDWNLWGQPQLLDTDIDLNEIKVKGVGDKEAMTLAELQKLMHLDDYDMNGRLVLAVESLDQSRAATEALTDAMKENGVPSSAVKSSSLYEIDFARICGKTIVQTGDSLRMSVGFPEGYNAGSTGTVFKVYHFIKDSKGNITGVEEIPVTVTPYGLVFLCDSFSPFAIVALDANQVKEEPGAEKTVMILAGEGGSFLRADGTAAAGENGVVTLSEGQHVTVTVKPDDGQAVQAITFDGHPIPVSGDGKIVIAYDDIQSSSCLLSASFISKAVQQADAKEGMTLVAADTSNQYSSGISERLEKDPGAAPESSTEVDGGGRFTDVAADAWYANAVAWAYQKGVTTGTGDGTTFSPMDGCTRAQFVTFLWRAAGFHEPTGSANKFSDVSATTHSSYYKAILWAAEEGITSGTGDGTTFSPDQVVTRAQAVTFMYRYAKLAKIATKNGTENFDDVTNEGVMAYYYDAIGWAVANGITDGTGNGKFSPNEPCQRGMMVTFLYRLFTDAAA